MKIGPAGNETMSVALNSKTLPQMREFEDKPADSIKSAAKENKEGWGEYVTRFLCFIPNMIWVVTKTLVYYASCCTLCKPDIDPAQVKKALEPLEKSWKTDKTKEEKLAAWKKFCAENPRAESAMKDAWVAKTRDARLGAKSKDDADKIKEWNAKHAEATRKEVEAKIANCDAGLVASYSNLLNAQIVAS